MTPYVLLFLYLNTLYLTCCVASVASTPKLVFTGVNLTSDEEVTETQHATCKIATEELVASAKATVTRVLTGACSAKAIDERLRSLERNLTRELEEIKMMFRSLLDNKAHKPDSNSLGSYRINHDDDRKIIARSPRQAEIDVFNNTVQRVSSANGSSSDFLYYWQIKDFDKKLASWKGARSERSPTFYAARNGYAMYMKATPRYFPDGTVFIAVGLTRGVYDSILKWPFPYKVRLEVLDHSGEQLRQDRCSRTWDPSTLCSEYFWGRPKLTGEPDNPECVGLSIPRQVLFTKLPFADDGSSRNTRYLWNDSVTVKLTVHL
ncbi:TNF receptor-associated factor 6-A [Lasioglossum baleicum]|uniref:TNF receptor-associated factor 6-A n=1 Tax=Lasioglossum baleicum TaxID=434251 RepID=UPI003FCD5B8E